MKTNNINEALNDTGMSFPIVLTNGSWKPIKDSLQLIEENLRSLILYTVGSRLRQEEYGTRLWECLEEPNTQALQFLIEQFLKDAISQYEDRIEYKSSTVSRDFDKLYIELHYQLRDSSSNRTLGIEYNL